MKIGNFQYQILSCVKKGNRKAEKERAQILRKEKKVQQCENENEVRRK